MDTTALLTDYDVPRSGIRQPQQYLRHFEYLGPIQSFVNNKITFRPALDYSEFVNQEWNRLRKCPHVTTLLMSAPYRHIDAVTGKQCIVMFSIRNFSSDVVLLRAKILDSKLLYRNDSTTQFVRSKKRVSFPYSLKVKVTQESAAESTVGEFLFEETQVYSNNELYLKLHDSDTFPVFTLEILYDEQSSSLYTALLYIYSSVRKRLHALFSSLH